MTGFSFFAKLSVDGNHRYINSRETMTGSKQKTRKPSCFASQFMRLDEGERCIGGKD